MCHLQSAGVHACWHTRMAHWIGTALMLLITRALFPAVTSHNICFIYWQENWHNSPAPGYCDHSSCMRFGTVLRSDWTAWHNNQWFAASSRLYGVCLPVSPVKPQISTCGLGFEGDISRHCHSWTSTGQRPLKDLFCVYGKLHSPTAHDAQQSKPTVNVEKGKKLNFSWRCCRQLRDNIYQWHDIRSTDRNTEDSFSSPTIHGAVCCM